MFKLILEHPGMMNVSVAFAQIIEEASIFLGAIARVQGKQPA